MFATFKTEEPAYRTNGAETRAGSGSNFRGEQFVVSFCVINLPEPLRTKAPMLVPTAGVGPVTTFTGRAPNFGGEVATAVGTTVGKELVGIEIAGGEVGREVCPVGVGVCPANTKHIKKLI